MTYDEKISIDTLIKKEEDYIKSRRERVGINKDEPKIGLGLSGGGIRSATFNLGLLEAFNNRDFLKRLDYISSVSGGGYINSYLQNELLANSSYERLFNKKEIDRLKSFGNYLTPYKGIRKVIESITFYITFVVLALLHFIWFGLFFIFIWLFILTLFNSLNITNINLVNNLAVITLALLIWYYFAYPLKEISNRLWSDRKLFYLISLSVTLLILAILSYKNISLLPPPLKPFANFYSIFELGVILIILGYFSNPNILSMHRYYRAKIDDAYIKGKDIKLKDVKSLAPYMLINSALNIQADKHIKGVQSCDYFLFSPLYCGSKLTGYVPTASPLYNRLSLSTAVATSGAAINSLMGYKSSSFISFLLTIINARLGYWALNPKILDQERFLDKIALGFLYNGIKALPAFWPLYNLAELFGKMNLNRWLINLSDGGGIENLGAYELFRREVKYIIVSDAGADPNYSFSDLRNLLLRVRNELEIAIEFEDNQKVEDIIYPTPSSGYSKGHWVVAKYYKLASEGKEPRHIGYFIYLKASICAPKYSLGRDVRLQDYYAYKNHHPNFPHETTIDQFFDAHQWEAYRTLGKEIGNKLLTFLKEEEFKFTKDKKEYIDTTLNSHIN